METNDSVFVDVLAPKLSPPSFRSDQQMCFQPSDTEGKPTRFSFFKWQVSMLIGAFALTGCILVGLNADSVSSEIEQMFLRRSRSQQDQAVTNTMSTRSNHWQECGNIGKQIGSRCYFVGQKCEESSDGTKSCRIAYKTWDDAEADCVAHGGHLASIKESPENGRVSDMFQENGGWQSYHEMWIGLTDKVEEGTWLWADGSAASFTNWAPGEPNNAMVFTTEGEDCAVLMYDEDDPTTDEALWNDQYCSVLRPYMCQVEAPTITVFIRWGRNLRFQSTVTVPLSATGADLVRHWWSSENQVRIIQEATDHHGRQVFTVDNVVLKLRGFEIARDEPLTSVGAWRWTNWGHTLTAGVYYNDWWCTWSYGADFCW